MCDKNCGNDCCKVVITKQGERGIQGPTGPPGRPGTDADINAANVGTGLGWWKQKLAGVLEFFSVVGVDGITATQNGDDIEIGIEETPFVNHAIINADITSTQFTISTVNSKVFDYKLLHNKMVYSNTVIDITGTYTGVTGEQSVGIDVANLPITFYNSDIVIGYLQSSSVGSNILDSVRSQVAANAIQFAKSTIPFTNGNIYTIRMSFTYTGPIV